MFHGGGKKCFSIESLVGKEPLEEPPIRPTALRFPDSLHPQHHPPGPPSGAGAGVFGGRTLYSGPELVLPEAGSGLPLHPLQLHPQSFFGPQHRDPLGFYPWVLRSRYLGHRFQGESSRSLARARGTISCGGFPPF